MKDDLYKFFIQEINVGKWRYQFIGDKITFFTHFDIGFFKSYIRSNPNIQIYGHGYSLELRGPYSWDGATDAKDFPQTCIGMLLHDILCQLNDNGFRYDYKDIDKAFKIALGDTTKIIARVEYDGFREKIFSSGFKYSNLYYMGVRAYHTLIKRTPKKIKDDIVIID